MNKPKLIIAGLLILPVTILGLRLRNMQPEDDITLSTERNTDIKSETENDILISLDDEEDDKDNISQLKQLVVGEDYFLVLYDDGSVWSWGNNAEGKLGIDESFVSEPQRVEGLENVVKLEDGGRNIFALTDQGDVYTWGQKRGFVITQSLDTGYYDFLYEPFKMRRLSGIIDITARNNKLYAINSRGDLFEYSTSWEKWYELTNKELLGEIDRMYAGAGNYDYFIRTDGTVFSFMTFYYNGYSSNAYAFIFPHVGDITPAEENILSYPPAPEGLPEITVLAGGGKYDWLIYYNLTGVDGIDTVSSDPYTMFLSKEDGTLCYWNSDRIKYHDSEFVLTDPDTRRERCNGNFEEICIEDILEMGSSISQIPRIVSVQSGKENTLFLTDDGQVFISGYETYEVADVEYGYWRVANPGKEPHVNTYHDMPLKELKFQKLELTDIESIWTNGENCFCAVDREGGFYRIVINDNEVSQVYQGLIPKVVRDNEAEDFISNAPESAIEESAELKLMTKMQLVESDGDVIVVADIEYDDSGNMIKGIWHEENGSFSTWSEFEYDESGNQIKETSYDSDGSLMGWSESVYDSYGNQVRETSYDSDGSLMGWSESVYDIYCNQIQKEFYNADGGLDEGFLVQYDDFGNESLYILHGADGAVEWREYEYDEFGNEIKVSISGGYGSTPYWRTSEYNVSGNLVRQLESSNRSFVNRKEWAYDASGNLKKSYQYDKNGSLHRWTEYEYDASGNLLKEICHKADGNVDSWTQYEYDSSGNRIRETHYDADDNFDYEYQWEYITIIPESAEQ